LLLLFMLLSYFVNYVYLAVAIYVFNYYIFG